MSYEILHTDNVETDAGSTYVCLTLRGDDWEASYLPSPDEARLLGLRLIRLADEVDSDSPAA